MKLPKLTGSLFRCGRCRKSYSNPLGHVCVSSRASGKRRLAPHAAVTCPDCGKPYANPLTHKCRSKPGDFKRRKAAHAKEQAAAKRKAAAAARRQDRHEPAACKDTGCQRIACTAYRQGYADGWAEFQPRVIYITVKG